MKGRTVLIVAAQIVFAILGLACFVGGLFAYDVRLGVSAAGLTVALAALFIDDGTAS